MADDTPVETVLDLPNERLVPIYNDDDGDEKRSTLEADQLWDDISLDDVDEALREAHEQEAMQPMASRPPRYRPNGANTGVKGVLADYAEAKERARLRRLANAEAFRLQMKDKEIRINPNARRRDDEDEEEEEEDDDKKSKELDPDDPEFIRLYREKRMKELLASQKKTFGYFVSITAAQFASEIDNEIESGAFVIIHLYQKYLAMSVRMNHALQKLSQKFLHTKFLKIIATDADAQYDDYALPTLLIYKNGDLFKSLIRITDELPDKWDQDDVQALLVRYNVLPGGKTGTSQS